MTLLDILETNYPSSHAVDKLMVHNSRWLCLMSFLLCFSGQLSLGALLLPTPPTFCKPPASSSFLCLRCYCSSSLNSLLSLHQHLPSFSFWRRLSYYHNPHTAPVHPLLSPFLSSLLALFHQDWSIPRSSTPPKQAQRNHSSLLPCLYHVSTMPSSQ